MELSQVLFFLVAGAFAIQARLPPRRIEAEVGLGEVMKRVLPGRARGYHHHVVVGESCRIDPTVKFSSELASGSEVRIGDGVTMYGETEVIGPAKIGRGTFINRSCYIRKNTTIGERVNFGPFVKLITDSHEIGGPERRAGRNIWPPIVIGDGVWRLFIPAVGAR